VTLKATISPILVCTSTLSPTFTTTDEGCPAVGTGALCMETQPDRSTLTPSSSVTMDRKQAIELLIAGDFVGFIF
jgi:hypothetical protein